MRSRDGRTLSLDRRGGARGPNTAPHLFLVLQGARPREPSARYQLDQLDEIRLGRGSTRRDEEPAARTIRIVVPDGWMSSDHARLVCAGDHCRLIDQGSKNGTLVNGDRVREVELRDGDLIELGQTFLLYREAAPVAPGAPPRVTAEQLRGPAGLDTLEPQLAGRFHELTRLAASKTSIVLHGPSGSGKELVAQAIHELSRRRGPFVPVNCAALPEGLVESELFGHVRGAFSGAERDRDGLIAASSGGTLFLDEIGDLPRAAQAKLLRALQEQEVRAVGATSSRKVDLRVVAATHRDLAQLVEEEAFREDLLARLGSSFTLPPLAERREDLGLIVAGLLGRIEDPRAAGVRLSTEAARALLRYGWPRNIRELQKALERAIALAEDGTIELDHLPEELRTPTGSRPRRSSGQTPAPALGPEELARKEQLAALLREHHGNVAAVARAMGKVRSQVQRWMKRYGLEEP